MESNRSIDGVTERIVVTSEQRDASRATAVRSAAVARDINDRTVQQSPTQSVRIRKSTFFMLYTVNHKT